MINNLLSLLTYENIYLVANWGIIPFWLLLIFAPYNVLTNIIVQSILPFLLLSIGYAYLSFLIYSDGNIFEGFELYNGLDGLYSMFANEAFLLIFWLHFLAISLFAGSWIVRDSKRYFVPKIIIIPSLVLTYFTGPIGLVVYWFLRIFFAKKISFND